MFPGRCAMPQDMLRSALAAETTCLILSQSEAKMLVDCWHLFLDIFRTSSTYGRCRTRGNY